MEKLLVLPGSVYVFAESEEAFVAEWDDARATGRSLRVDCCRDRRTRTSSGGIVGDLQVESMTLNPATITSVSRVGVASPRDTERKRLLAALEDAWERHVAPAPPASPVVAATPPEPVGAFGREAAERLRRRGVSCDFHSQVPPARGWILFEAASGGGVARPTVGVLLEDGSCRRAHQDMHVGRPRSWWRRARWDVVWILGPAPEPGDSRFSAARVRDLLEQHGA
jgi:hypothetical protein